MLRNLLVITALAVFGSVALGSNLMSPENGEQFTRELAVDADGYGQVGQSLFGVVDSAGTTTTSDVEFGYNVAISDDGLRLAVSSYRHDWLSIDDSGVENEDGGAVFVYDYDGVSWVNNTHFVGDTFEEMGRWPISLSPDGQTIAIRRGTGKRPVQVFSVDAAGTTSQLGSNITCAEAGSMISLTETSSGVTRIAVACEFDGSGDSGLVKVLDYNSTSGAWEELSGSPLSVDPTGTTDGLFGFDLVWALDGTRLAVSAPNYNGTLFEQGLVRVYDFDGSSWTQLGGNITGTQTNEKLGFTIGLSADGTTLVIGSPNKDTGGGNNTGAVRIYALNATDSSWDFQQEIAGESQGDVFGRGISVSVDGTLFSASSSAYESDRGQVQVFEVSSGTWSSIASFVGNDFGDLLGFNTMGVAMTPNGERLAMAAIHAQTNGVVYVFDNGFTPMPSLSPSLAPTYYWVSLDYGDDMRFSWDIEPFPEQTEIGFSEDVDTSEIILYYNISNQKYKVEAFEIDCITPIPSNVTSLTSQFAQDSFKHGNVSVFVDIQQENVLESDIWSDVSVGEGLISLCIRLDLLLGDVAETSVHFHETKMNVSVGLFQGFEITGIELDRLNATENVDGANVEYSIEAFHCDSLGDETNVTLTQGSDVYLCIETDASNVQIDDVQELTMWQSSSFNTTPIVDGDEDALTEVSISGDGKKATIRYQIVSAFFDDPSPEDIIALGSVLMKFADDGRRLLRTVNVLSRRELEEEGTSEAFKVRMAVESAVKDSSSAACGDVVMVMTVLMFAGAIATVL